jgi:hypothetical protein
MGEVRLFIGGALFQGDDPAPDCFTGIVGGLFPLVPEIASSVVLSAAPS